MMMTKNYFTDEQVNNLISTNTQYPSHVNLLVVTRGQIKKLMNLAVEVAIGEAVGELSVDYQGFRAYKNNIDLPEGYHNLHSVKELENQHDSIRT